MRFAAMSKSPERATLNFSDPGFSGSGGQSVGATAKEPAAARKQLPRRAGHYVASVPARGS